MRRDPTVPRYLPHWPATWPDTAAEARTVVKGTDHATQRRFVLGILVMLAAGATLVAFLTLPLRAVLPLVLSAVLGALGAQVQARRRRAAARRRPTRERRKP